MKTVRLLPFFSLTLLALVGCGPQATVGEATRVDAVQITGVIQSLNDAVQDPAKLQALCVAPLADAAKYKDYLYYVGGQPSVTGTTATCKVKLEKPAGTAAGEPQWEFEKVGDAWKIKTAPLS
jgi:hypothetical protein